jgi:hypothetical protein
LVSDSDTPDLPIRYHDALPSGALAKAALDDANLEQAQAYKGEFNAILQQAFVELRPKSVYFDREREQIAKVEAMKAGQPPAPGPGTP